MKKALIILLTLLLVTALFLLINLSTLIRIRKCSLATQNLLTDDCLALIDRAEPTLKRVNSLLKSSTIDQFLTLFDRSRPFLKFKNYLLGQGLPEGTSYMIMLQNNNELRANGGFFGSYAVVNLKNSQPTVRFEDIYTPDGQLPGHVDPPASIQAAFKTGEFRLRDSDYSPSFTTSSQTIRWFMDKGREINPDLLLTLSLDTIKRLVAITGPLDIPEYQTIVDENNIYNLLQTKSEVGFFPGSTQKKDVISATGKALLQKALTLSPRKQLALVSQILDQLDRKNILINSNDPDFQQTLDDQDYSGKWRPSVCEEPNCTSDTFAVVQLNVGANKANCCTDQLTEHTITKENGLVSHSVTINFHNNSESENPTPPLFYGGNYIDYLRLYLPPLATDIRLNAQPTLPATLTDFPLPYDSLKQTGIVTTADRYDFKEIGFFHTTRSLSSSSVTLTYRLPAKNHYQLTLLKQHGLISSPQTIHLFNQTLKTPLETDFTLTTPLN